MSGFASRDYSANQACAFHDDERAFDSRYPSPTSRSAVLISDAAQAGGEHEDRRHIRQEHIRGA